MRDYCRSLILTSSPVATLVNELALVEAEIVRWKNRAIVITGRSLSGQSALVLSCVERGAEYHSDEYAVFDSE